MRRIFCKVLRANDPLPVGNKINPVGEKKYNEFAHLHDMR
jgi:hypothetical protein